MTQTPKEKRKEQQETQGQASATSKDEKDIKDEAQDGKLGGSGAHGENREHQENPESQESQESQEHGQEGKKQETSPETQELQEPKESDETKYMRLMADFQNYKKRVTKEKSDIYAHANEKIATDLLEILDNFERALAHEGSDEGFKTGMEMIFKQLGEVLEKAGLSEIPALGEEFDPNLHNAVMTEETDEVESGKVSGVMQKGYSLNGKVIRPSMVKVAQ